MKNVKKYYFSVLALLFIGLILFFCGFALMDFNLLNFDTEPVYTEKKYVCDSSIPGIRIDDSNTDISVGASADGKIHIKYFENANYTYDIYNDESGNLCLIKNTVSHWSDRFFNISVSTPILKLELPDTFQGILKISSENGNITLKNFSLSNLSAECENGYIRASKLNIKNGLSVETDNGEVDLYDITCALTAKISTENGRLFAQSLKVGDLYTETDNGLLTLADITAADSIFAEVESGNTELSFVSFGDGLTVISENGDISGSVVGTSQDFSYNCISESGNCNLPKDMQSGSKQLNLRARNGNIDVSAIPETVEE